ncbi:hypothetical protein EDD31_2912 [Bogoriella caseilytica]|uniref:Uncharacterized protein n=1 Tax=Bogoriella caseilytica TaxID=56055 RepID=A0A3N2BHE6_9MICO|nr:hypothetical protein EDD31_2912 [Bogoriella caseilytica]
MFGISLLVALLAVVLTWGTPVVWVSSVFAIIALWAFGVSANFRHERHNIPNTVALASMVAFLASVVLAIVGMVL